MLAAVGFGGRRVPLLAVITRGAGGGWWRRWAVVEALGGGGGAGWPGRRRPGRPGLAAEVVISPRTEESIKDGPGR